MLLIILVIILTGQVQKKRNAVSDWLLTADSISLTFDVNVLGIAGSDVVFSITSLLGGGLSLIAGSDVVFSITSLLGGGLSLLPATCTWHCRDRRGSRPSLWRHLYFPVMKSEERAWTRHCTWGKHTVDYVQVQSWEKSRYM